MTYKLMIFGYFVTALVCLIRTYSLFQLTALENCTKQTEKKGKTTSRTAAGVEKQEGQVALNHSPEQKGKSQTKATI